MHVTSLRGLAFIQKQVERAKKVGSRHNEPQSREESGKESLKPPSYTG